MNNQPGEIIRSEPEMTFQLGLQPAIPVILPCLEPSSRFKRTTSGRYYYYYYYWARGCNPNQHWHNQHRNPGGERPDTQIFETISLREVEGRHAFLSLSYLSSLTVIVMTIIIHIL
ncbi:hypothetical protein VTO42DRAFT_5760 [Malbranchea cinnamomea]